MYKSRLLSEVLTYIASNTFEYVILRKKRLLDAGGEKGGAKSVIQFNILK
jgi:hypothetical protein